jgi:hypothetical protein
MKTLEVNRPLTDSERELARFMLVNGTDEATTYLEQLQDAEVTSWRCACGCGSINFKIKGRPEAPPGVNILGDFLFGEGESLAGIFIFSSGGTLSGVEVYGLPGAAPAFLPTPQELRAFDAQPCVRADGR